MKLTPTQMNMLIARTTDKDASDPIECISLEELLKEQHSNAFWRSLRSRLSAGWCFPFIFRIKEYYLVTSRLRVISCPTHPQKQSPPSGALAAIWPYRRQDAISNVRKTFDCPTLAMDGHPTAKLCATCAMNCVKFWKQKNPVRLFHEAAPL